MSLLHGCLSSLAIGMAQHDSFGCWPLLIYSYYINRYKNFTISARRRRRIWFFGLMKTGSEKKRKGSGSVGQCVARPDGTQSAIRTAPTRFRFIKSLNSQPPLILQAFSVRLCQVVSGCVRLCQVVSAGCSLGRLLTAPPCGSLGRVSVGRGLGR